MPSLDLKHLLTEIYRERRVDFSQYREKLIARRIAVRLRATQKSSYEDYFSSLRGNREEMDALLAALTINVSEFFRDPEAWAVVRDKILPEILEKKKARKQRLIHVLTRKCPTLSGQPRGLSDAGKIGIALDSNGPIF